MVNEISHGKIGLTNFFTKVMSSSKYLRKLSSMRYGTYSTFTEFNIRKEKLGNEVNDKDISCQ